MPLLGASHASSMPLTDVQIRKAQPRDKAYRMADSGGLHLEVSPAGGKLWRWKYRVSGRGKRLSLGAIDGYTGQLVTKCALRLAPLVFVRPGALRQAECSEIDLMGSEWNIPAAHRWRWFGPGVRDSADHPSPAAGSPAGMS